MCVCVRERERVHRSTTVHVVSRDTITLCNNYFCRLLKAVAGFPTSSGPREVPHSVSVNHTCTMCTPHHLMYPEHTIVNTRTPNHYNALYITMDVDMYNMYMLGPDSHCGGPFFDVGTTYLQHEMD